MACLKQKYKFFGMTFYRSHEWRIEKVSVFMYGVSRDFHVVYKCAHCDVTKKETHVDADELMKNGYTAKQLTEIRGF